MTHPTPLKKMILSAIFLAMGFILPLLTGQIPEIGGALLPLHIPALLCGFVCGPAWGAVVGGALPLLRCLTLGMPPLMTAIAMTFELLGYGLMSGLLYRALPKRPAFVYVNLVASMLVGRILWGIAKYALMGLGQTEFSLSIFWVSGFVKAVPGIILQIVVIPIIILALQRAGLMEKDRAV